MRKSASTLEIWLERLQALYSALVRVRLPRILGLVRRNPRDSVCAAALALAVTAIVVNGLYLQPGRHPAPIFAVRPLPVMANGAPAAGQRRRADVDASRPEPASRNDPAPRNDPVPLPRPRAQSAAAAMRADAAASDAAPPSATPPFAGRGGNRR